MDDKKITMQLSPQEKRVVELMRNLDYGELRIIVNASKPIRVEEIKKSFQL